MRGAKAQGIRFENLAGRELRRRLGDGVRSGQWFAFVDDTGLRYAQVDHFVEGPAGILAVECKLTFTTEDAWYQLERKYAPILALVFRKEVAILQACKNLHPGARGAAFTEPEQLFAAPKPGRFTWHYLGR